MRGSGTLAILFATMAPQTVVSMMSLTPPIMAEDVIATLALPAGATGLYTGLIYFFVLLTNLLSAPLMGWVGPLRLRFACIVVAWVDPVRLRLDGRRVARDHHHRPGLRALDACQLPGARQSVSVARFRAARL